MGKWNTDKMIFWILPYEKQINNMWLKYNNPHIYELHVIGSWLLFGINTLVCFCSIPWEKFPFDTSK